MEKRPDLLHVKSKPSVLQLVHKIKMPCHAKFKLLCLQNEHACISSYKVDRALMVLNVITFQCFFICNNDV